MERLESINFSQRLEVKNLSAVTECRSTIFKSIGYDWQVCLSREGENLSLSLEVVNTDKLPCNWSVYAQFYLYIVDQKENNFRIRKVAHNEFHAKDRACGFNRLITLEELCNPSYGYIVKDICIIQASVENYWPVIKSFVGLNYQGATSCMIPLVNALYHIPLFRKAVYHMSKDLTVMPSTSLALLTLFFKLQYGKYMVATKELPISFRCHAEKPQDCFKDFRMKLESEMKGTTAFEMFKGHYTSHIMLQNEVRTSRQEFYELQLECEGCLDVNSSIAKFEEAVSYTIEPGQQAVLKWACFVDFPSILMLKLKPFKNIEPEGGRGYELSLVLNPKGNRYTLHSVLVGGETATWYSAYTRPTLEDKWFEFDDGEVKTFENLKSAMKDGRKHPILLVYIRDSEKDKILCNVDENDVGDSLKETLKSQVEKDDKRQEKHYTIFKVTRDKDLDQQFKEGTATMSNLVDHDKVQSFKVPSIWSFKKFKKIIYSEFNIKEKHQRYWLWSDKSDSLFHLPLMPDDEKKSVGELRDMYHGENPLKLFLEVELNQEQLPVPLPQCEIDNHILLFVLRHRIVVDIVGDDCDEEEWRYLGHLIVSKSRCPKDVLAKLKEMAGFEDIQLMQANSTFDGLDNVDLETSWEVGKFDSGDVVIMEL